MIGGLSPEARALLRAAKSDSPPGAARAAIWNGVEQSALPVPTAPPALPAAAAAAPAVTMKAAFVGAVLGSVLSAGITLALLSPMHGHATEPEHQPEHQPEQQAVNPVAVVAAPAAVITTPVATPVATPDVTPAATPAINALAAKAAAHPEKARVASGQDSLSREVALVAEARGELLRGDASRALATIRVARSLKVRQLEPEELALEVRALRALGRTEEADRVDAKLRAEFPEHALAR